jgi:hypothetical protein
MQTDFQILGIEPTDDPQLIKQAYRRLVKEIHPDIAKSGFDSHLRFIAVQQAYQRLSRGGKPPSPGTKPSPSAPPRAAPAQAPAPVRNPAASRPVAGGQTPGLATVKDQAYALYRAGVKELMKVHPSVWNDHSRQILVARDAKDLQVLKETELKVRKLIRAFPRAYYYFSIVANDFPDSVWAADANEKLAIIEHQTVRYRSIIESFMTHAFVAPRVNR